ncbi:MULTISPECIES: copper chaperone CopZ [Metabacillus]|uniref:copper chaperone CopZ n=1 Tax=Metabacillus TaxID=2675233 RepID=UPI001B96B0EB|nr:MULTISPECIES: copper chaperone CopZ [Metabacillus]MCM3161255.1 copper chaperone CopZ [Metabacillus litoralis]MCM3412128.1 copper chaperone CopZ [Metabacillus litoralis]UGB30188.1 copper chaperone CopZ [Metabacillus sp. B2-18]UHA61868.1 copper chaperone CopZ [Metabacillus litoralis]
METVTIKVEGMSCQHCVNSIEGSVGKLEGVSTVKVDLDRGTVNIDFDPEKVTKDKMKDAIEDQGYDVL